MVLLHQQNISKKVGQVHIGGQSAQCSNRSIVIEDVPTHHYIIRSSKTHRDGKTIDRVNLDSTDLRIKVSCYL